MSHVMCKITRIIYHMSHVMCHMTHFSLFILIFGQSDEAMQKIPEQLEIVKITKFRIFGIYDQFRGFSYLVDFLISVHLKKYTVKLCHSYNFYNIFFYCFLWHAFSFSFFFFQELEFESSGILNLLFQYVLSAKCYPIYSHCIGLRPLLSSSCDVHGMLSPPHLYYF